MSGKLAIFIFIHIVVFAFFVETLRRVDKRASEYKLKDTRQTLSFVFVRLRHTVVLYVLSYIVWFVVSIILYFNFISPNSFPGAENVPSRGSRNIELNL